MQKTYRSVFGACLAIARTFSVVGLATALASTPAAADPVKREGEGARRQSLTAMELKPFDLALFSKASEWAGGVAPQAGDLNGRVVVLLFWSDWYPPSKRVVAQVKRLVEQHGKDGVTVVALHSSKGWDAAKNLKFSKEVPLYAGLDTDDAIRKALSADQDPDVYVIDRAGQLRYADIDKASLESGVALVLKESANDAGTINETTARKLKDAEAAARRSGSINERVNMVNLPEQEFTAPTPDQYKAAKWPKMPNPRQPEESFTPPTEEEQKKLDEKAPDPFSIQATQFLTAPAQTKGRITLVYFWHPESRASFQMMDIFDAAQKQLGRDVTVIGAIAPIKVQGQSGPKDPEIDPIKIKKIWDEYIGKRIPGTAHMLDLQGTLYNLANGETTSDKARYLPVVALVSSDGLLRWGGFRYLPSFDAALEKMLAVDPGVKARRAAEADYIKQTQGK